MRNLVNDVVQEPCSLPPPELFNSPESISEYAARILFMTVTWIKSVPAFTYLALKDQVRSVEHKANIKQIKTDNSS